MSDSGTWLRQSGEIGTRGKVSRHYSKETRNLSFSRTAVTNPHDFLYSTSEKRWAAVELANMAACNDDNKFSIAAHDG